MAAQAEASRLQPARGMRGLAARLGPDLAMLFFFSAIFVALAVVYGTDLHLWELSIVLPTVVASGLFVITTAAHLPRLLRRTPGAGAYYGRRLREIARDWAPFIGLVTVYEQLWIYTGLLRHDRFDAAMLAADRALFSVEPTLWMGRFVTPAATNFFALMYNMYFPMPMFLVMVLGLRGLREDFQELTTAIVIAMFLGFLGFTLVPVGPPRFFLEGQFDPPTLRGFFFEISQDAQDHINRTKVAASFPSMHAGLSLLSLIYARRFGAKVGRPQILFAVFALVAISLWIATVYLRHHWVVDLFAGFAVAIVAATLAPWLRRVWPRAAAGAEPVPRGRAA
jgi:membrane-associated phospholipid phosphatase